jgi:uncharacterized protein YgbK (DUF1537 family)
MGGGIDKMNRPQRLLTFYGDDFTGTTATAEALTASGVSTVMFIEPPKPAYLKKHFPDIQAVGIAGIARSLPTDELDSTLRSIFKKIKAYDAPLVLYKVCSTFDSAPHLGSIGRAAEIGKEIFASKFVPILPAAPRLGRFTIFGNHFVAVGEKVYRMDRHPSMPTHPATPMKESDLRQHLAKQTDLDCGFVPILQLEKGIKRARDHFKGLMKRDIPLILFDTLLERHLNRACEVIWDYVAKRKIKFCIGSQEIGFGLAKEWKRQGWLADIQKNYAKKAARKARKILVVSGSCASVTGRQIKWASTHGFTCIRIDPAKLFTPASQKEETARVFEKSISKLNEGQSVIIFSAIGPEDTNISNTQKLIGRLGLESQALTQRLGGVLGDITKAIIAQSDVKRVVLAGGDISGKITPKLGISALQVGKSIGIAAPLCYAYSSYPEIHGLQLALKGGQIGEDSYFGKAIEMRMSQFEHVALGRF